jgi:hypothetical protein
MGYSLRSIGTWIGLISFLAAVLAVANTQIQWHFLWVCLGLWLAIVLLYCLVKLVQVVVRIRKYSTRRSGMAKGSFRQSNHKKLLRLQKKTGPNYTPLQRQRSKGKGVGFKFPLLVGFAPHQFQVPSSRQQPSPANTQQQQKARRQQADFKLPPLAGFAPQDLEKPTRKNPHQDSSDVNRE